MDCLNSIVEISFFYYEKLQTRLDSATSYAIMANNEATQLKYKAGNVKSLLNLARIQSTKFHINQRALAPELNTDDLIKNREGYVRKALLLAEEIQDDELLGNAYYTLAEIGGGNESTKKAIHYYRKANNISKEFDATVWLCMDYAYSGEYEEGLKYAQRCEQLIKQRPAQTEWEHEIVTFSFFNTSMFYKAAGDYNKALNYLIKSEQYVNEHHAGNKWNVEKSELYCLLNKFDSALYYWQVWKRNPDSYVPDHLAYGNSILELIYFLNSFFT